MNTPIDRLIDDLTSIRDTYSEETRKRMSIRFEGGQGSIREVRVQRTGFGNEKEIVIYTRSA
jgi:hypothetical protein